ncbi:hypothetical protein ACRRS0_22525 [Agarivorans sp. QJM3NY_29]|uniref:hypothetical protein n=1 Tax=unclassified Agarivorans TaxID=2636026 RepID=UPI003D7E88C5
MSKIEIPQHLLSKLGAEMKMDCHWIDVKLNDGSVYPKMVVRGGRYITGSLASQNGVSDVPFTTADIKNVRRQTFFSWWPFW